jgi:hypothetical protein
MFGIRHLLRERDESREFYRQWASNAQGFHGAVFDYIQSVVILGALRFAVTQQEASWPIWVLYAAAYLALLLLTTVYFRTGLLLILKGTPLKGTWREASLWIAGALVLVFNIWLVGALGQVVEQIIAAGLSGNR